MTDGNDNSNDFPDGSIIRIEFREFLTYEKATLTAGRNLNLIIGVNGSGKSTVICGICLAVGGSPKNLGRSESIGDFVRHGKEQATVELAIADKKKGPQKFKIIISRTKQTCEYFINNVKTTPKHVKDLATAYNIQIDNPCTFLAQDKVKSFSEQNPVKLLSNTIKAGDPQLLVSQEDLIKKRNENKELVDSKANTENNLAILKAEIETLEPRVQNYYKQRQQDSKINALVQRQKFMEFDSNNASYKAKLTTCKKVQTKLDKRRKEEERLDTQQKELSDMNKQLNDECTETRRKYNNLLAELRGQARGDVYDRLLGLQRKEYDEARKRYDEFENVLKAGRDRQRDIERTLEKVKRDINECQHDSMFLTSERQRLIQERINLEDQINVEKGTLNKIRNDMRQLQYSFNNRSPFEDKLRILNGDRLPPECSYAAQAWSFLENNDTGITVNVPFFDLVIRKDYAKYIEALVPPRDMLMFIFQSKEDEIRVSQRFPKINSTVMTPNEVRSSNINVRIPSKLKEFGFDCFAVEMLQGPEIVLNYLCQVNGLNRIPVGSRPLEQYDETSRVLVDSFQISRFITGNQLTNLKVSKYSGEMISNNRPLFPSRFFVSHEKAVEASSGIEAQKRKLADKDNEVVRRLQEFDRRRNDTLAKKEDVENKLCELKKLREKENVLSAQLEVVRKRVLSEENNKPDLDRAKAVFDEQKKHTAKKTLETAKEIIKQLEVLNKHVTNVNVINVMMQDTYDKMNKVRTQWDLKRHEARELETKCKEEEHDLAYLKNKVKSVSDELKDSCNVPTTDESKLNATQLVVWEKIKERFEQHDLISKSKDEIDNMLAQEQAQKKMRARDGKLQDVERHRELKLEQEKLQKVAAEQADSLQASTEVLQKEIEKWQAPVEKLIAAINVNYSKFFQELGCVGEIFLDKPSDELDIANYGIHINVSFRANEKPKRLDHQVQSGGERSVATMLYLLALQELCPVPFRCVDEINQGMDPTNERKVFDVMVNKLTGCGNLAKTQYFLLTPKLLHGLTYNDKVTIQCVHNSRALYPKANEWNPHSFLEKVRSSQIKSS